MKEPKNSDELNQFIGKKFRIAKDTVNHNIPIGTVVTCTKVSYGKPCYLYFEGYSTYASLMCLEEPTFTKKELEENLKTIKKQYKEKIDKLTSMLNYLDITQTDVFDYEEYRVFNILKLVEKDGMKEMDKVKAIAQLIKEY